MKFTLKDFYFARAALSNLIQKDLPVKAAYRLGKLAKKAESLLKDIEVHRLQLIEKYGEEVKPEQEGEASYKAVLPPKQPEFEKEMTALLDEPAEIDYEPMSLDMLGSLQISASELVALEPFLKE